MPDRDEYSYTSELSTYSSIGEGQERYPVWMEQAIPFQSEIGSDDDLRKVDWVASAFRATDWSFSNADTGFLTHALHPYPAKFIPQIPSHCIQLLSRLGEVVLDPFGGSGTTALEAVRLGRRALSVDANPIGTLIGQVKTCNLDFDSAIDLRAARSSLNSWLVDLPSSESLCEANRAYIPDIPNIDRWFPLTARGELALIRSRIASMETTKAQRIALLALSRIVLSASFQESETRYTSKPRDIPPSQTLRRFLSTLDDVLRDVLRTQPELRYGVCEFVTADTRNLGSNPTGTGICRPNSYLSPLWQCQ